MKGEVKLMELHILQQADKRDCFHMMEEVKQMELHILQYVDMKAQ